MTLRNRTKIHWLVRCKSAHGEKDMEAVYGGLQSEVVKEMLKEEKTVGQQEERIYDITIKEEALYKKKQLY